MNLQEFKLIFPEYGEGADSERRDWITFVLNMTKHTESGKWNEKYSIMTFKARFGYISVMDAIVKEYVKGAKQTDDKIITMEEVNDDRSKTWVVGNPENIKQMVDDEFKSI